MPTSVDRERIISEIRCCFHVFFFCVILFIAEVFIYNTSRIYVRLRRRISRSVRLRYIKRYTKSFLPR
jgi:hypothetical protein